MKDKYIFIPLFSLIAIGGAIAAFLALKNKKKGSVSTAPLPIGNVQNSNNSQNNQNTNPVQPLNPIESYTNAAKEIVYKTDTSMILLFVYGKKANIYEKPDGAKLLKTATNEIGWTSLDEFTQAQETETPTYMRVFFIDGNSFKKGYVKKSECFHSSFITYTRLREMLGTELT